MPKKIKYTPSQIKFLRTGYLSINIHGLTKAFNDKFGTEKTEGQITATLKNHKIRCGRKPGDRLISRFRIFTTDQVQFIRDNYTGRSVAEMTVLFNNRFETDRAQAQVKSLVDNRGINSGRTSHFPRGNVPWNTGTKGLTTANKSSFKKGHPPANRKPIGSERICSKGGFVLIKIAEKDPCTGFPTRYKHKHVHVYEQENGPVPKGMVVALKDGDKTNCEPENLMLISRAELLNLNRHGYKDMPAKLKPSVLALAKLQIKTWAKEKYCGDKN